MDEIASWIAFKRTSFGLCFPGLMTPAPMISQAVFPGSWCPSAQPVVVLDGSSARAFMGSPFARCSPPAADPPGTRTPARTRRRAQQAAQLGRSEV
jgi:hypothetical protein